MDARAAQGARSTKYGITAKKGGNVTKPENYAAVADDDFCDPVNYRYPMDGAHIHAALAYWGKPANRAEYSPAEQALMTGRMEEAAKRLGVHTEAMAKNRVALNFEMPAAGSEPPCELMLIPPGRVVTGRDGRSWNNPRPQGVVDFFTSRGVDLCFDLEHASELRAPKGEPAPAVAWGKELFAKPDGSVWARMEWNQKGRELVMNREYRYYSPVLVYSKSTNDILGLASVGLTNKPNLDVTALNHEEEEAPMLKKLLVVLGLPETTTEEVALNQVTTMRSDLATALNRAQTPDLAKFVPRGDYDAVLSRASNAEQKLKDKDVAELETALNAEIDGALKAGKIVPATKEFYVAMCRQEGGLEQFRSFVKAAPVIGGASNLDSQIPEGGDGKALNATQKEVCAKLGISEEEFAKAM